MSGLQPNQSELRHGKLQEFLNTWPIERLRSMTLEAYSDVGSKDTFTYWVEFETEPLGRIGGRPANKFGVWKRKVDKPFRTEDFATDGTYGWRVKHGTSAGEAFSVVREQVLAIAENAQLGNFKAIDGIDYDSLVKWKIAFLYSELKLLPIYKKDTVRRIARYFEHPNYEKARFSELHPFILAQKPVEEDIFDFAYRHFFLAEKTFDRNYYVIGSKYEDDDGNDTVSILPQMLDRQVIATGFFGGTDFTHLYRHSRQKIGKWCDKNLNQKQDKYDTAKRTLSLFLGLRPGDIVAVKSHGNFNRLTIVAYAQVKEVKGKVYEPDSELGHIVHVDFLENGLWKETGLTYAQTIHQITPGDRVGHFEKIFGSYALLESETETDAEVLDEEDELDFSMEEDRINDKQIEPSQRTVSYTTVVSQAHNKIQLAFARHLKRNYPNDTVRTESRYVDIKRESQTDVYLYEVKPFNSAYACIRAGIGQLLDYCHSYIRKDKVFHLVVVGAEKPSPDDMKFIEFVRGNLNISFEYISFSPSTDAPRV